MMRVMQYGEKHAILKALADSEASQPAARTSAMAAARQCVRAQLHVECPDLYVIHRCLETLYREMRDSAEAAEPVKAALDRAIADVKGCIDATAPKGGLYAWVAPKAKPLKALIQMAIAVLAVTRLGAYMWHGHAWWGPRFTSADDSLGLIGRALAAATVVELAYTLFTDGPDEVLDPLMLGISSFLIIELGRPGTHITWGTGLGLLLTAITLGLLFAVRQRFIADAERVPRFWPHRLLARLRSS